MSSLPTVMVVVEGKTEVFFINRVLAPYLANKGIMIVPTQIGKTGGHVSFARVKNDISKLLKQRSDTWVTLFVDYYGIDTNWPGYRDSIKHTDHVLKASLMRDSTFEKVKQSVSIARVEERFIPYVGMHEFEALLFADTNALAEALQIQEELVSAIVREFVEPERINNSPETAPSKRLKKLSPQHFIKTVTGVTVTNKAGIDRIREACPLFNDWVTKLENLQSL